MALFGRWGKGSGQEPRHTLTRYISLHHCSLLLVRLFLFPFSFIAQSNILPSVNHFLFLLSWLFFVLTTIVITLSSLLVLIH